MNLMGFRQRKIGLPVVKILFSEVHTDSTLSLSYNLYDSKSKGDHMIHMI